MMMHNNFHTHRDEKYLDYIRSLPCCVSGKKAVPHHVYTGGMGVKCSDYLTIPLSHEKHMELHDKGKEYFADKYGIDYDYIITKCLIGYLKDMVNK